MTPTKSDRNLGGILQQRATDNLDGSPAELKLPEAFYCLTGTPYGNLVGKLLYFALTP